MKVILTTVNSANVTVLDKVIGKINRGFLLLVGFTFGDDEELVSKMVDKILNLRVFPDEAGKINLSLADVNGSILSISQFTLDANSKGSRRPSFIEALSPSEAEKLYDYFNKCIEERYGKLSTGIFGADMKVTSENDGPFTLILDSKELYQ